MRRIVCCIVALLATAAPVAARAQLVPVPAAPGFATNPVSDSPLQQQILRNYRSDLQQTQRELAMRNPSGLSREQIDLTHQLNAVNSALHPMPPSPLTPPGAPDSVPFR